MQIKNRILVVEDDLMANKFYKLILSKAGYEVVFSEDSEKIIEIIKNSSVDLTILDINLKNTRLNGNKTDGVELSKYLKTINRKIPIIIVTAYKTGVSFKQILESSLADSLISKPISDYNLLLEKIREQIN